MNRYKATVSAIVEGEDEEEALDDFCQSICEYASGEVKIKLLEPLSEEKDKPREEEKEYIVNLTVKITDRILIHAETIEGAKKAAKRAFFSDLSEYQVVNAAVEYMDVEIEKKKDEEVKV